MTPDRHARRLRPNLFNMKQFMSGVCADVWRRLQAEDCTIVFKEEDLLEGETRERVEVFRRGVLIGRGCNWNLRKATALALIEAVQALDHDFHLSGSDKKSESDTQIGRRAG